MASFDASRAIAVNAFSYTTEHTSVSDMKTSRTWYRCAWHITRWWRRSCAPDSLIERMRTIN